MMIQCPICHVSFVREVLSNYQVLVRRDGETEVGGLEVLTCSNHHIFFVRKSDLIEREACLRAAA
jgi:succinyl-CoA synthetase beta subunit